jgi:hypothetical protein
LRLLDGEGQCYFWAIPATGAADLARH